jgi:hypothetical protein
MSRESNHDYSASLKTYSKRANNPKITSHGIDKSVKKVSDKAELLRTAGEHVGTSDDSINDITDITDNTRSTKAFPSSQANSLGDNRGKTTHITICRFFALSQEIICTTEPRRFGIPL